MGRVFIGKTIGFNDIKESVEDGTLIIEKATILSTPRTIDGLYFDGSTYIEHYGVCSTNSTTATKTVSKTGFLLSPGARITVKFTNNNTVNSPTLNVNNTGAKPIKADGDTTYVKWLAGSVMDFVYDGEHWVCTGGYQLAGKRVGFVYISNNNTSPATLYGGSWTAITDRFLIGASATYPVGSTGGEATVALSAENNGPHTHNFAVGDALSPALYIKPQAQWENAFNIAGGMGNNNGIVGIQSSGGGQPHNNMPPYRAEYMWYRTA